MCKWRPRVERRVVTEDNFLLCDRARGALLPSAWEDGLIFDAVAQRETKRMKFWCPTGQVIDLSNSLIS